MPINSPPCLMISYSYKIISSFCFVSLTILTELCSSAAFQGQSRAVIVTPAPLKREGILTPATSQSNVAIAPAGIVRVRRRKKKLYICFLGLLFASSESHNVLRRVTSPLNHLLPNVCICAFSIMFAYF